MIGLGMMTLQDIKSGEIHQYNLLLLMDFKYYHAYLALIFLIPFYPYIKEYIGDGDLIIFVLLASRYGLNDVFCIILISSIIALAYLKYYKLEKIRYIPFIFMGYLIKLIMI